MIAKAEKLDVDMTAEDTFWVWFTANASRIADAKPPLSENLLDEVMHHLHSYNDGLYFEIGGHPDTCDREFIVTAERKSELFSSVMMLCDAAPRISGWKIPVFKPPQGFGFKIDVGVIEIDPVRVWFKAAANKFESHKIDLHIAVPGCTDENADEVAWACRLIVQTGIGERIATERVGDIGACGLSHDPQVNGFTRLESLGNYLQTNYQ